MTSRMKAAVLVDKERFEIEKREIPRCCEGEVLIKVKACAICGSDLRIFHGQKSIDVPITGHEISGIVEKKGENVNNLSLGDKVIIQTVIGCGECYYCRRGEENLCFRRFKAIGYQYNGGFAQFLLMPRNAVKRGCVIRIPAQISFDEATIVEPLSCVINGWNSFKERSHRFTAVIIGAGIIGMLHSEYAKLQGSKVILINRSSPRLVLAKKIGLDVDVYINSGKTNLEERIMELTDEIGANVIICATSSKAAQRIALKIAAVDADISFFAGISKNDPMNTLDTNLIHYKELHLHGANSSNRKQYIKAVNLIATRKINVSKFITHRFSLERIEEAFATLQDRGRDALKIIIDPWL